jgi:hypothetical protein
MHAIEWLKEIHLQVYRGEAQDERRLRTLVAQGNHENHVRTIESATHEPTLIMWDAVRDNLKANGAVHADGAIQYINSSSCCT